MAPNIIRKILEMYPNSPWPIEREVILLFKGISSCAQADKTFGLDSQKMINALVQKETRAQEKLLAIFNNARILQMNYSNILPTAAKAPDWCSGLLKEDINYVRGIVKSINKKIKTALNTTAINNPRLELVDVENALGDNALSSIIPGTSLANSINEDNFNAEARRLLNLDGNGDAEARRLIDQVAQGYDNLKQCWVTHIAHLKYPLIIADCDTVAAENIINQNVEKLTNYLTEKLNSDIFPNLIAPSTSNENAIIHFDRSRGLLHPNAKAHEILACKLQAAYNGTCEDAYLPPSSSLPSDTINGSLISNIPLLSAPLASIHIKIGGFQFNDPVSLMFFSNPISLGSITSDSNGIVEADITLPDAEPGVHTLELQGNTLDGAGIHKQARIEFPGKPDPNGNYSTYLTGFTPNIGDNNNPEFIDIQYLGQVFETLIPDENGGILVELPLFGQEGEVQITATSQTTGTAITKTIEVADTLAPEINIISPKAKTYTNTQGQLLISYTVTDNADPNPQVKVYLDDQEYTATNIDLGKYLGNTDHSLKISAADASGNLSEKIINFTIAPQPLKSFAIKDMKIKWRGSPKEKHSGKVDFIISGKFELPAGIDKKDLDNSAIFSLAFPNTVLDQQISFKDRGNLWMYQPPKNAIKDIIKNAIIHWAIDKNLCHEKHPDCLKVLNDSNAFYIRGQLDIPDIQIGNATTTLELPLAPTNQKGSLIGAAAPKLTESGNLFNFTLLPEWKFWANDWYEPLDDLAW